MKAEFFWKMVKKEVERQQTSFEWLYRKTKISKGTFSSWKNRNTIPRADEAFLIANALNVSVEYLLTGVDKPRKISNTILNEITEKIPFFDDYDIQTLLATVRTMSVRYQKDYAPVGALSSCHQPAVPGTNGLCLAPVCGEQEQEIIKESNSI